MWHEVRKQERRIRCMIVDYKRRAERRKDYYDKIKADPTQFLQIHGRPCKIHLDPSVAMAGDSPAIMMSWQGSTDVIIDRFDVRAHLDFIQDYTGEDDEPQSYEDRHINYERYRILVQNDFLGVPEEKFLHQLNLEEQFGIVTRAPEVPIEGKKKVPGAAIGFNYDDPSAPPETVAPVSAENDAEDDEDEDDEDSDIDFDVCVDVNKVTTDQAHELNSSALPYGMESNDFFSFLTKDREEADNLRIAKELEEEKAMYSGRKSRRERRAYREKKLAGRIISPPSYASRKSPTYQDYTKDGSRSRSRSDSPVNAGKITYITSFGGEEQGPQPAPPSPKARPHLKSKRSTRSRSQSPGYSSRRRRSRSRSLRAAHRKSPKRLSSFRRSYSRSRSPVKSKKLPEDIPAPSLEPVPPPIITRYYARRGCSSSSELSVSDEETDANNKSNANNTVKKVVPTIGNSSFRNKHPITTSSDAVGASASSSTSSGAKMTPQERLKRKMQALINKQYKADKKAEREKREKMEQERMDREDEMREISIKLRKRERMRRHEYLAEYDRKRSDGSSSSSRSRSHSSSSSRSQSYSPSRKDLEADVKRRGRSDSGPKEKPPTQQRKWDHCRHSSGDRNEVVQPRRFSDQRRSMDRDNPSDLPRRDSRILDRRDARDEDRGDTSMESDARDFGEASHDFDHQSRRFSDRSRAHSQRDHREPGRDWRAEPRPRDSPRDHYRTTRDAEPKGDYRGLPSRGYRNDPSYNAHDPTSPQVKDYRQDFSGSRDYHRQPSRDVDSRGDYRPSNSREWNSRSRDERNPRGDKQETRDPRGSYRRDPPRQEYSRSLVDY